MDTGCRLALLHEAALNLNKGKSFDIIYIVKLEFLAIKAEHLEEVLGIERLSFPEPWTRGMFEREISLPISHFFVANLEKKIVGYSGYWQVEDEAHLINLAVHPDFRCRGLGRQILNYLCEMAVKQGLRKILLEVRESNSAARKLYESCGFLTNGLRLKYYQDENAVLMVKNTSTGEI